MCYGLTWTFAWMKKFVFFFAWSLFLLPQDENGYWHLDLGHVTTWQCIEFVCDNVTIPEALEYCFIADDGICCRRNVGWWYRTAEVQMVILAPLQYPPAEKNEPFRFAIQLTFSDLKW